MFAALLRRDPAVRATLPIALAVPLVTVGYAKLLAQFEYVEAKAIEEADAFPMSYVVVVLLVGFLAAGGARTRVLEYQLPLPLSARTWIALRWLGLVMFGLVTFLLTAVCVRLIFGAGALSTSYLGALGVLALLWVAWITACFAWRPHEPRLTSTPFYVGSGAVAFFLAAGVEHAPWIGIGASVLTLAVAVPRIWRGVPERMRLASEIGQGLGEERGTEDANVVPRARPLRTWVARRTLLQPVTLAFFVLIVISMAELWRGSGYALVFLPVWCVFMIGGSIYVLTDLGHLPVSRRALAPWVLLPALVSMLVGLGTGEVLRPSGPFDRDGKVDLLHGAVEDPTDRQRVRVPAHLLELTWGLDPIEVAGPDGETARVRPERVLPLVPLGVWNPYDIEPESSRAFVAWQLARAVRDAHGVELEPEWIDATLLTTLDGEVISPWFTRKLEEARGAELPVRTPRSLPVVGLGFVIVAWLVAGYFALWPNVPPGDASQHRARRRRTWLAFGTAIGVGVFVYLLPFLRHLGDYGEVHLRAWLAGWLDELGPSTPTLLAVLLAVAVVVGYRALVRRFEGLEVPNRLSAAWWKAAR